MATNPSNKLPEFIDNTWTNQSSGDRLRAIELLQQRGPAAQDALLHIARHDEYPEVRCGAVRYLRDIAVLIEMQQSDSAVAETAKQQYHRILAGAAESEITEQDRLLLIQSVPVAAAKQIALLAKSKPAGVAALEHITQAEELMDVALFASSVHVRKYAASRIEDKALLQELFDKVQDKDKSVARLVEDKLAKLKPAASAPRQPTQSAHTAVTTDKTDSAAGTTAMDPAQTETETAESSVPATQTRQSATSAETTNSHSVSESQTALNAAEQATPTPEADKPVTPVAKSNSHPEKVAEENENEESENKERTTTVSDKHSAPVNESEGNCGTAKKTPRPGKPKTGKVKTVLDPVIELPRIAEQLKKLSYKHTDALNVMRNTLNQLRKSVPEAAADLQTLTQSLSQQVAEKLDKNHTYQEHLQQLTIELLSQLKTALDEGQSHEALPAWDKIQGNINNTSGKIRAALQKQANEHKAKLNELRDWKTFAATEKKKELITQMQHLLESKMHAADRSKHISKMHAEWKSLGRSNQNEKLWREFKKLSDKAYEPCKEYFKQRKQLMAANLVKRREICDHLEAELTKLDSEEALNISQMNKLLNDTDKEWKAHAPIEQSKIKPLQKRYYAALNQLRKTRKQSLRGNGAQKLEFIAQANALVAHEDNQHAMREAKRLQQEWKEIGPTSFKEDKKYWEDFRAACDKIFAKRNQEADSHRESIKQSEAKLTELLQSLETIYKLDDEAFREARGEFQAQAQQFSNAIDPRQRNQVKRLLEQFNGLKRKIDGRYKTLPDKKQMLLKNNVLERARFLQAIEAQLLSSQDASQFNDIKNAIDTSAWEALPASGESKYDSVLEERLQRIQKSSSTDTLRKMADEAAGKVRALCIELEIRANIDTPKEDQGLRMQIQLDQLKNGFGKLKPDAKENSLFAQDVELQSHCLGPIEENLQQQLSRRLEEAARKLL